MKIKSIKVIKGKNKWSESKTKLIHMVLDLGEFEQKPSNKIDGFYERIKKHLPSLKSHKCSLGRSGGFFQRVKEGTWMGHIIEHVALELQTLAGYDTGWGRTRGVKGQKGVYNVVFNYENKECGKLAAKEAFNVVNDIINNKEPKIEQIVKKLKPKTLKESIKRILREELESKDISHYLDVSPFYKLPYPYQKSLMIFRNEGTTNDMEIKDLIDDELQTSFKRKMFYYGVVPIKLIEDEVTERLEWDSFENYHKWYGDEETDHGDSVLPIIIDFDDEELIIDGWHRFHSYVRKGLTKIPVLGVYED